MAEYNNPEEEIEAIRTVMDKKMIEKFGESFNDLVSRALKSYESNSIDHGLYTMNKDILSNVLETAQILRDETSEEKIKREYKKHQSRYLYDTIREYSMLN